jgi:hypothetical protein
VCLSATAANAPGTSKAASVGGLFHCKKKTAGRQPVPSPLIVRMHPQTSTFLAEKGGGLGRGLRRMAQLRMMKPASVSMAKSAGYGPGCSRRDVLDLQAVGEFDKAHFQVLGFRDVMGGFHHAFQPLSIGGDQRHVFTGH